MRASGTTVADIAGLIAALATAGLLVAAYIAGRIANRQLRSLGQQVELQRNTELRRRVYEHLAQLFESEFVLRASQAKRLFKARPEQPGGWQSLWDQKTDDEKAVITSVMNFYEVVAGEYNDSLLDRAIAHKALIFVADATWLQARPFVKWLRTRYHVPRAYDEWERMHDEWDRVQRARTGAQTGSATSEPVSPVVAENPGATGTGAPTRGTDGIGLSPADTCPDDPCVVMPPHVLGIALVWLVLLVASLILFERWDGFADAVQFKLGRLPFEAIWFGAAGGLLVSLQGIFDHNHSWRRSFDYWHMLRPVLGALLGTLGCLVFIVLTDAATKTTPAVNPVFYDVVALAIGYREESFRVLLKRLIDTIILPPDPPPVSGAGRAQP